MRGEDGRETHGQSPDDSPAECALQERSGGREQLPHERRVLVVLVQAVWFVVFSGLLSVVWCVVCGVCWKEHEGAVVIEEACAGRKRGYSVVPS